MSELSEYQAAAVELTKREQEAAKQESSNTEVVKNTESEADTPNENTTNQNTEDQPKEDSEHDIDELESVINEDGKDELQEPETKKYKVKVDGEELEVTEEELLNGYSREANFRKKTQSLAEERKSFEKVREETSKLREEYSNKLAEDILLSKEIINEQFSGIDWKELSQSDPEQYLILKDAKQTLEQKIKSKQEDLVKQISKTQQENQKKYQELVNQEFDKLQEKDPEFKKDPRAKYNLISSYLENEGFAQDEVSNISDHRHFIIADKARRYDEIMAKLKNSKAKKSVAAPKFIKSGTSDTAKNDSTLERKKMISSIKPGDYRSAAEVLLKLNK